MPAIGGPDPDSLPVIAVNLSYLLGLGGSALFIASCVSIHRKRVLSLLFASTLLFVATYLVKHDLVAGAMVVSSVIRNALFTYEEFAAPSWLSRKRVLAISTPIVLIAWSVSTMGVGFTPLRLLILIGPLVLILALASSSMLRLKSLTLITSGCWLTYEFFTGAYTVMIGEAFGIGMLVLAIFRLRRAA